MAFHKSVNAHIYEDQLPFVREQLGRGVLSPAYLEINPDIKTLGDVINWVTPKDFKWAYSEYHPAINYPFSV